MTDVFRVGFVDGYFFIEGRDFDGKIFTDIEEAQSFINGLLEEFQEKDDSTNNVGANPTPAAE